MILNVMILTVVFLIVPSQVVLSATLSPRNHQDGVEHDPPQTNHELQGRDSTRISSGLQPFYISNSNTIYGGYSSQTLKLKADSNSRVSNFYQQDLYGYIKDGITPQSGIFGFAAHFDPTAASDYTFFKSISNDKLKSSNLLSQKEIRSISSNQKRQDDRIQCRNQSGDSLLFSKNDCLSAADKMTSEKTAMSTCGGCQLIMIGPQGQLSSSNMPASDLQAHATNILSGCVTGRRFDASNSKTNSLNSIPKNLKPSFVLLLTQGSGPSCS